MADIVFLRVVAAVVFPGLVVLGGFHASKILAYQRLEGLGVDVAHECEHEVVGVGKAFSCHLQTFGIVDLVVILGFHALAERMVAVEHFDQTVAESGHGV